jgi:hypothetical protein
MRILENSLCRSISRFTLALANIDCNRFKGVSSRDKNVTGGGQRRLSHEAARPRLRVTVTVTRKALYTAPTHQQHLLSGRNGSELRHVWTDTFAQLASASGLQKEPIVFEFA